MRWICSLATLLTTAFLMQVWFAGSPYKEIHTGNMSGRRGTSIMITSHLSLGQQAKPLQIADGIFLTEVVGDWLGRMLLVDVKARRNHIFAGETCKLTIKATCSRTSGDDLIAYDTGYCENGYYTFCTGWAKSTEKRVSLRKGHQAVLKAWCRSSFIPLARTLITSWGDGGTVTYLHTVTTFLPTYHSWLVSCK
jgi:hypothetical protein